MKSTAVDKAFAVLDLLIGCPEGLRPGDVANETGYPSATVYRLLATLTRNSFVSREPGSGRYVLGYKFLRGFNILVRGLGLQEKSLPHLRRLAQTVGQAANLGVLRADQVLYLESVVADCAGSVMYSPPGTLRTAHHTALGKAILAQLPDDEMERYVRGIPHSAETPNCITSTERLAEHLAVVRRQGYAIDDEESDLGVRCAGAAILNHCGQVVAGVSISAPVPRLPLDRVPAVAEAVVDTARRISADLGYEPPIRVHAAVDAAARR